MAAFFALEEHVDAEPADAMCAVWGLDQIACQSRTVRRLKSIDPTLSWLEEYHDIQGLIEDRIGTTSAQRLVAAVRPSKYNSRLALQQGTFLFLGDPGSDLFANLSPDVEGESPLQVVRLEFPRRLRREALRSLGQWGINREALFPGLDGLAQSLVPVLLESASLKEKLVETLLRPSGWPGDSDIPPATTQS